MSLLDGKYQIVSERRLSANERLFEAVTPEGRSVDIVWYDLGTSDDEVAFERFRRLLRTLKRHNRAALLDIVSRPGAHYAVWDAQTPTRKVRVKQHEELASLLAPYGFTLSDVQLRSDASGYLRAYDVPFGERQTPRDLRSAPALHSWRGYLARTLFSWLPGLLLSLTGGVLLLASFYAYVDRPTVDVPDLLGSDVNEAARALTRLGFEVETDAVTRYGTAGKVLELRPTPGTLLRSGRTVELRYLLPPDRLTPVSVPELRRGVQMRQDLETLLSDVDLNLGQVARIAANTERGTVLAQSPPAGYAVAPGTPVDVLVSDGPEVTLTFLPDLRGLDLSEATTLARIAGITTPIATEWLDGSDQPPGTVVEQNVTPNTAIAQDLAQLRLTVVRGEQELVRVSATAAQVTPDFIGMTLNEAERTAREEGLELSEDPPLRTPNLPSGVVFQNPEPGALNRSGRVALTLNRPLGDEPTPPPPAESTPPQIVSPEDVEVQASILRRLEYNWELSSGIPRRIAQVTATTPDGERTLIDVRSVEGGEEVQGLWLTTSRGPVTFRLTLNGLPYGEPLVITP